MEAGTTTTNLTARLPILNPADYDLWLMRIEQYFLMTDYSLWEVIKNALSSEIMDQTFDRLQKLISQLEIQGEVINQEDMNLKLLRSLLSEWKTHALIWRNKVGDEAVHKELGDRMERAATTASSLEAEQDSEAHTRFEAASNSPMTHLSQELTHLEVGRTFWETASASISKNKEMEITAIIDGRVKTITEASIRRLVDPNE
ncbi:hypothetical protein Tco_0580719 [Tanacetum coccineum]